MSSAVVGCGSAALAEPHRPSAPATTAGMVRYLLVIRISFPGWRRVACFASRDDPTHHDVAGRPEPASPSARGCLSSLKPLSTAKLSRGLLLAHATPAERRSRRRLYSESHLPERPASRHGTALMRAQR